MFKPSGIPVATQAQQETATAVDAAVTPGRQQYHPSSSKGWCNLNGTGTIAIIASYNTSGISDGGTGNYTISWNIDFSSANYAYAIGVMTEGTQNIISYLNNGTLLAGSVNVVSFSRASGSAIDVPSISVVAFGDQA